MNTEYPATDLVILAGGQARRMNGMNKLLQQFDDQIQLLKICEYFKTQIQHIWVNSHRDNSIYKQIEPDIQCYADDRRDGPAFGGVLGDVLVHGRMLSPEAVPCP